MQSSGSNEEGVTLSFSLLTPGYPATLRIKLATMSWSQDDLSYFKATIDPLVSPYLKWGDKRLLHFSKQTWFLHEFQLLIFDTELK